MIISVLGLYKYEESHGRNLFAQLELPAGIDKETVVNEILLRSSDFESIYPDADFCAGAIGQWGKKCYHTFDKWIKALNVEYNPLENYDRIEEWNEQSKSKANSSDKSSSSGIGNTTNTRSAYDSDQYQPHDAQSSSSINNVNSNTKTDATGENIRTGRAHGNIGVTTSQQMLQSELDIAKWNLYSQIADLFIQEFCVFVY